MKKVSVVALILLIVMLCCSFVACFDGVITESRFFQVMTAIQYYPSDYVDLTLEFDCFTYRLTDVNDKEYICGVRKCSSGYGCVCGNDTIIGFVLEYDGEGTLPEPRNQSEDTNDKAWVHLTGKLKNTDKMDIEIYSYKDGVITTNKEKIQFLVFVVESFRELTEQEYSGLNYYVTK